MSVTRKMVAKHMAELTTLHDLECEGFAANAFIKEMDALLESLNYEDDESVGTSVPSWEEPWRA